MRVVLIGGHLSPALCVLGALPKDTKVLFIGRKYSLEGDGALSLEYETITSMGIPFVGLNTGRLQRRITKFTLLSLLKIPAGLIKSFLVLAKCRPDVVVGFGGYVSVPVIVCAYLLGIPVVIHEQTMKIGFGNRLVSKFAKKICISWESSREYFPKNKVVLTGNPVRKFSIVSSGFSIFGNKRPIIYITGGSSGAHAINVLIEGIIKELLYSYNVIHQVGDTQKYCDFERLECLKRELPPEIQENYILKKFIEPSQIGDIIKSSSLVITRSGINTVTELVYFEKPALLIPLPFSQKNEQQENAKYLEKIGLGKVFPQSKLTPEKLLQKIKLMLKDIEKYKINKEKFENIPAGRNAAQNIVSVINYVYKAKTEKKF
jgi:UDP-N-acetylglucosamine--N-acetylmuramyl-(pentapeptide) pyrophosphoryl-undecaprenol N-acetylglucosamine transferase